MLKFQSSESVACLYDTPANVAGNEDGAEVVEIGLLLPANWAIALIELSKVRGESVAQILRASVAQTLRDVEMAV
jgi:hypothetical protein